MPRAEYDEAKYLLQVELLKFQNWAADTRTKHVLVFEGRDAAGKRGTIKRFMEHLNPRYARTVALTKPSAPGSGRFARNGVHIGVEPRLRKGAGPPGGPDREWFHIRQNKHHRWSLDENQIYQYHLAGALHPQVQWLEAMDVPPRSLQFVSVGEEITIASLVCQDLAEADEIADVIRSVGPTVVFAVVLDGPQLASRWAARYASVFADDPGSVVLTLTSFGMAQRSRPPGHEASLGIADPSQRLVRAIESLNQTMQAAFRTAGRPSFDAMLAAVREDRSVEQPLDELVRAVLRSTLEQLRSRQAARPDLPTAS